MLRNVFASLTVLALGLVTASADELKGTLKKVNKDGNSLTLTVDGKDKVLSVGKDASFVTVSTQKGKKGKTMEKVTPIDGGLGALKEGSAVTVLTEKAEDKESVTSVKVTGGDAPAKKAKKAKKPKTATIAFTAEKGKKKADKAAKGKKAKKGEKKAGKKGKKKAGKGKKAKKSKKSA